MRCFDLGLLSVAAVLATVPPVCPAQDASPAPAAGKTGTLSVQANLVVVPAVVYDKKGLVTTLQQGDFAISVNGKPQTVKYFDRDTDVPLTVGLLVDTSRSQTSVLDDEGKASDKFLQAFLKPATANRPADKAFVLQFAHTSELLQDVTDSRSLLAAGLKEIGTAGPGAADDEDTRSQTDNGGSTTPNNGGSNHGGYGSRGGYPGRSGGSGSDGDRGSQARGGTVLYDAVYLASDDVLAKQKGRRALIVLTDGVDRHSKESLKDAIEAAQRADTVIYAIYYKGQEHRGDFNDRRPYGGYPGYGYPGAGYPGSGGRPGSDGTYADPDGKKILERICGETGGRMYEVKGRGGVDAIYEQIGDELRAQYRLGFTPTYEAASAGYHPLQLSLTNPAEKKLEIQTRDGYYTGAARPQ